MAKKPIQRVLIYENRKIDPVVWDISSSRLEQKAFLDLFKVLDKGWKVYSDLTDLSSPSQPSLTKEQIRELPEGRVKQAALAEHETYPKAVVEYKRLQYQRKLYDLSKKGDAGAAKELLSIRKDYEYESWAVREVH